MSAPATPSTSQQATGSGTARPLPIARRASPCVSRRFAALFLEEPRIEPPDVILGDLVDGVGPVHLDMNPAAVPLLQDPRLEDVLQTTRDFPGRSARRLLDKDTLDEHGLAALGPPALPVAVAPA